MNLREDDLFLFFLFLVILDTNILADLLLIVLVKHIRYLMIHFKVRFPSPRLVPKHFQIVVTCQHLIKEII